jgi:hypothetical protein
MKISDAIELTKVVVPFGKDKVTCDVSGERMTFALMDEMQGMDGDKPNVLVLADAAARIIAKWDLQEDDGSIVPLTAERLRNLDQGVLMKIINAVFEAVNPTKEEAAS